MLNLVTGVFVEGAQRIVKEDKDAEFLKFVMKTFEQADSDKNGEISWDEFHAQLKYRSMDSITFEVANIVGVRGKGGGHV